MAFPTTPIIDAGPGADQDPLAGIWAGPTYSGNSQLRRSADQFAGNAGVFSWSYWNVGQWTKSPGMEIYFDIPTVDAASRCGFTFTQYPGAGLEDGYQVDVNRTSSNWRLAIVNDAVNTPIGADVAQAISSGDGAGVSIIGDTFTIYYRSGAGSFAPLFTRSDATFDNLVMGFFIQGGTHRLANVGGGAAVVSTPPPVPGPVIVLRRPVRIT